MHRGTLRHRTTPQRNVSGVNEPQFKRYYTSSTQSTHEHRTSHSATVRATYNVCSRRTCERDMNVCKWHTVAYFVAVCNAANKSFRAAWIRSYTSHTTGRRRWSQRCRGVRYSTIKSHRSRLTSHQPFSTAFGSNSITFCYGFVQKIESLYTNPQQIEIMEFKPYCSA